MNKLAVFRWRSQLRLKAKLSTSAKNFEFMANKGFQIKDTKLSLSSGIFGHLSESSVMCRSGGSVLHASVNSARAKDPNESGLPLTVDYRARQYAFGMIPAGKNRREIHGSQDELLVARFIDRAIRPLFPKGYVNEIQLTVTSHASDGVHDPTVAAVNAASFALMKSNQPWNGPIGCVRVGLVDGVLKIDPTLQEMETSTLDFLYAGTAGRALMIETAANQIPDETIKAALRLAHSAVQDIITAQCKAISDEKAEKVIAFEADAALKVEVIDKINSDTSFVESIDPTIVKDLKRMPFVVSPELKAAVFAMGHSSAADMYAAGGLTKAERGRGEGRLRGELLKSLSADPVWSLEHLVVRKMAVDAVLNSAFREVLLQERPRIDGRHLNQLRDISCAVEVMPSVHGSAYFARGDTHVLSTTTLGSKLDGMEVLPITGTGEVVMNNFMLHYDFPPYCTGEMGNVTSVNRRMVGHGKLAERAVRAVMPSVEEFPYTVRVYSECTSSNGSSSMASVCSASLALMDAGVPIHAPVAGLSVGLITHENLTEMLPALEVARSSDQKALLQNIDETSTSSLLMTSSSSSSALKPYVLLKDILGTEDHNGDMDFKIAGSAAGVTAIQLDVKLEGGVPLFMLEEALDVAREGRLEILSTMSKTIVSPREDLKSNAPRAELVHYDAERRSQLTGQGGEMVKYLQELFDVQIDTTVDGIAYIFGRNSKNVSDCRSLVQDIAVLVKVGDVLSAQVLEIRDFGLMVKVNRAQEGLLHVSDISHDPNLMKRPLEELFRVGQRLDVQVYAVDKSTGTLKVSRKSLLNPESSVPDHIRNQASASEVRIEDLPVFPVIPPRKFSKEFFKDNVVSPSEAKEAMKKYARNHSDTSAPSPSPPPSKVGAKTNQGLTHGRNPPKLNTVISSVKHIPVTAGNNPVVKSVPVPPFSPTPGNVPNRLTSGIRTRIIAVTPASQPVVAGSKVDINTTPPAPRDSRPRAGLWDRLRQTLVDEPLTAIDSGRSKRSSTGAKIHAALSSEGSKAPIGSVFSNVQNKLNLQSETQRVGDNNRLNKSLQRAVVSSSIRAPANAILRDSIARTYGSNNNVNSNTNVTTNTNSGGSRGVARILGSQKPSFTDLMARLTDSKNPISDVDSPKFRTTVNRGSKTGRPDKSVAKPQPNQTAVSVEEVIVPTVQPTIAAVEIPASSSSLGDKIVTETTVAPSEASLSQPEPTLKSKPTKRTKAKKVVAVSVPETMTSSYVPEHIAESRAVVDEKDVLATALNKLIFSEESVLVPATNEPKKRARKTTKATPPLAETVADMTESAPVKKKVSTKKTKTTTRATEGDTASVEKSIDVVIDFSAAADALQTESSAPSKPRKTSTKKIKATIASVDSVSISVNSDEIPSADQSSSSLVSAEEEKAPKKRKASVRKTKATIASVEDASQ